MTNMKIDALANSVRFASLYDPVEAFQSQNTVGAHRPIVEDLALKRLMLALLEDALNSYRKYFSKPSRKNEICFREVEEWIASDADGLFSFGNVCESLEIDVRWLRAELLRWKNRQLGGVKPGTGD